jgi:hypothetical protein
VVETWKPLAYVVFEQATRGERACSYRFKVQRAQSDAMLAAVQALNPTDLSASTESAKRQKVQFDGELSILLRKQAILESTLESSVAAYDELVTLAKSAEDVETLSRVIDSKLAQIERLTRERITLAGHLQQLARQMAELEDRIEFVYFNLTIEKYEIVDGDAIVDSWVAAMRTFAFNLNQVLQSLTLGLLANLLLFAQIILYVLMLLVAVKYGWSGVVRFWKR